MSIAIKVVLLGDGAVGKTSFRNSFMGHRFIHDYQVTFGADFSLKELKVDFNGKSHSVSFMIWDLAGQPRFQDVRSIYYSGSHAALVMFDVTRFNTFENSINWLIELKKFRGDYPIPPVILIGNKVDLREYGDTQVSYKEGKKLVKIIPKYYCNNKFDIPYLETSAKTGKQVELAFRHLGKRVIQFSKDPAKY